MRVTLTDTWETESREVEFEISGEVTEFVPAKVSGPPENCYPAEGGDFEDISVRVIGSCNAETGEPEELTEQDRELIANQIERALEADEDWMSDLEGRARDEAAEMEQGLWEEAQEAKFQRMRDGD